MPREDGLLASVRRRRGIDEERRPEARARGAGIAVGPRTLQRRLKDSGVDFKTLVDDTRRRFALRLPARPEAHAGEIAYLLGYSEVSAFNRAFRRWTGSTPSDYRRRAATVGEPAQTSSTQMSAGSWRRRRRRNVPSGSSMTSGARG